MTQSYYQLGTQASSKVHLYALLATLIAHFPSNMAMMPASGTILEEKLRSHGGSAELGLLVELPAWHRAFFSNLRDLIKPRQFSSLDITSAPAPFWTDVFVKRGLPWGRFLQSAAYHAVAFGLLLSFSRLLELHPQPTLSPSFDHAQVIYYQAADYLPPLDTRSDDPSPAPKSDPEFSRQAIISVPSEADNRSQTIVTPPNLKLKQDVPLPNIVSWTDKPNLPIAPAPLVPAADISRITPQLQAAVVAPPPDLSGSSKTAFQAPQPSIVEPPPVVADASSRQLGEIHIARADVIAPAPQLAVSEQRVVAGAASGRAGLSPQVVPPPPEVAGSSSSAGGARLIALNLHPTVGAPPVAPQGNRRGSFAATPEGHVGASGTPGASTGRDSSGANGSGTGKGTGSGNGSGSGNANGQIPAGLYVGRGADPAKSGAIAGNPHPAQTTSPVNPRLLASIPPPRVTKTPTAILQPEAETKLSESERAVFGPRKFYSLTLNMPNFNSAGGSWVIRFAELKQASSGDSKGLSAPAAMRKVDPAYPLELMRQNLAGTVIVYAVIRADGTVNSVRVLQSVDDRLDQFASEAVSHWQFQPATKDGNPVDVEATFHVPFRPSRPNF